MNLVSLIALDIKRMFSSKGVVLLCILAPIFVLFIFFSVVYPGTITSGSSMIYYGIVNEDESDVVSKYIDEICYSESLKNVSVPYPIENLEKGEELLNNNDLSLIVHIPENFFDKMKSGETTEINIIGSKSHTFEMTMVGVALETSLSTVGQSQNILEYARAELKNNGIINTVANHFIDDFTYEGIVNQMNRRAVIGKQGPLSQVSEFLPFEYYIGVIFSIFSLLGILPIINMTAKDLNGTLIKRGLLIGHKPINFYISRIVSGCILILLILLMLLPAKILVGELGYVIGLSGSYNLVYVLIGLLIISLTASSLGVFFGTLLHSVEGSLWLGFYGIIVMIFFSGVFLNNIESFNYIQTVAEFMPLRLFIRMITNMLFEFNYNQFLADTLKLIAIFIVIVVIGIHNYAKRSIR
ncbi:MAG TPA: ABC transporter permease [Anaerovoracaceae bacterium]|nr:ABC transporter permease [Anaerovoracaceae bacterium]